MKKIFSALAVSLLIPATAMAAEFSEVDANADGLVSMDEAKAAMPDLNADAFLAADANGDGSLSTDEFAQLQS